MVRNKTLKPKPLPCRLHPKDKVRVRNGYAHDSESWEEIWIVGCIHDVCAKIGVSRHHAITRWNAAQKGTK